METGCRNTRQTSSMITTALINLAYYLLNGLIALFPAGSPLPSAIHTAATTLGSYLALIDSILPVDTLATILGLYIIFELTLFAFKTFKWLFGYIPFVGGKG